MNNVVSIANICISSSNNIVNNNIVAQDDIVGIDNSVWIVLNIRMVIFFLLRFYSDDDNINKR